MIYEDKTSKEKGKRAQACDNIELNERGHLSLKNDFFWVYMTFFNSSQN